MENDAKISSHSVKELRMLYGVSCKTMAKWLATVPDLGEYIGKRYTPKQVKQIFDHLEKP